jgi:lysozyme
MTFDVRGLDLSELQGALTDAQWKELAAKGVRFVYLRAGVGNETGLKATDARFLEYVAGARAAGIAVGAYGFAYVLPNDPAHPGRDPLSQACAHFAACEGLGSRVGDLPPVLDLEWPDPSAWDTWGVDEKLVSSWALQYLEKAATLWGRRPLLYTFPWFVSRARLGAEFAAYELWLAAYDPIPQVPAPWNQLTVWQKSGGDSFKLPNGVPCDEDAILDELTFRRLLLPG